MRFMVIIFFVSICQNSFGQDFSASKMKTITLGLGKSFHQIKDERLSMRTHSKDGIKFLLGFRSESERTRQDVAIAAYLNFKATRESFFDLNFIRPQFQYALEKKVGNHWIGGQFSHETFLLVPKTRTGHFSNNPISYTMINSLSPRITFDYGNVLLGRSFDLETSFSAPLLSYVVRPAYGHPYPEGFLKEGVFTPTREGMGARLITSGQLLSLDKYIGLQLVTRFTYYLNDSFQMGVQVNFEYSNVDGLQPVKYTTQEVLFTMSYSH